MGQLEGRNCWDYILNFFGGILQPEMAQLEGRNWKGGTAGTTSSNFWWGVLQPEMAQLEGRNCWDYIFNFFLGDPAARDLTVGREELLGFNFFNFPWKIKSQRWLNKNFFHIRFQDCPLNFLIFFGNFLAGFYQGCTLELFELFKLFDPLNFLNFLALQFTLLLK